MYHNWCVSIILLVSNRYNVCTCRSPIYCCLSSTTCLPVIVQYITTPLLLLSTWYTVCRGYVMGGLEIEEHLFEDLFEERFDTK